MHLKSRCKIKNLLFSSSQLYKGKPLSPKVYFLVSVVCTQDPPPFFISFSFHFNHITYNIVDNNYISSILYTRYLLIEDTRHNNRNIWPLHLPLLLARRQVWISFLTILSIDVLYWLIGFDWSIMWYKGKVFLFREAPTLWVFLIISMAFSSGSLIECVCCNIVLMPY